MQHNWNNLLRKKTQQYCTVSIVQYCTVPYEYSEGTVPYFCPRLLRLRDERKRCATRGRPYNMLFESLGFKLWTVWSLVRKNAVLYCTVHPDEQVVYNSAILFFLQYCQSLASVSWGRCWRRPTRKMSCLRGKDSTRIFMPYCRALDCGTVL